MRRLPIVDERKQALVLQFGQVKQVRTEPGIGFKLPLIQDVLYYEGRILPLETQALEVTPLDERRLVVDAFARWRITDPLLFYQTVSDERIARSQLGAFLEASLRRVLGSSSFEAVVRDERNALMQRITEQVNAEAKGIGINVVDVRIKRAELPEANSLAIYRRMQTERQREAAEIRAQGEEASRRIRATADRQVTVLKAEATGESERIRGQGDAEKNRVFADAFGKDPDFFAFYRSMQAYQAALQSDDTRLLLSPNSQFFQYFNDSAGGGPQGAAIQVPEGVPELPKIVPAPEVEEMDDSASDAAPIDQESGASDPDREADAADVNGVTPVTPSP